MKKDFCIVVFLSIASAFHSCKNESSQPVPDSDLTINLLHQADGQPAVWDSIRFRNDAGEEYSLTRLQYFLSNWRFYQNNKMVYAEDTVVYIDARKISEIRFKQLPEGTYDSVSFIIGIGPERNVHGKIRQTAENVAMEWPDVMGGGYHFLKLEGHWKSQTSKAGYAIHLGNNPFLIYTGAKGIIKTGKNINLSMNLNEWYRNPNLFSFETDGDYTMGVDNLMEKITENGKTVFSITP